MTAHRRENIGEPLERIVSAVADLAREFPSISFVFPVHKNPAVSKTVREKLQGVSNCLLTDPLEYGDLVWVMKNSDLIMTDSGGIQEEAPTFKKPVLVLKNETERPEAVEYGTSFLVGSDEKLIVSMGRQFLNGEKYLTLKRGANPFGDGLAAEKIVKHVVNAALLIK